MRASHSGVKRYRTAPPKASLGRLKLGERGVTPLWPARRDSSWLVNGRRQTRVHVYIFFFVRFLLGSYGSAGLPRGLRRKRGGASLGASPAGGASKTPLGLEGGDLRGWGSLGGAYSTEASIHPKLAAM